MTPWRAVVSVLRQYRRFDGRARPAEFWWWTLVYVLACVAVTALVGRAWSIDLPLDGGPLYAWQQVASVFLLPHVAVTVRRLHDLSFSGWWALGYLLPFGGLGILMLCALDTGRGPNRYGPDPRSPPGGATAPATGVSRTGL